MFGSFLESPQGSQFGGKMETSSSPLSKGILVFEEIVFENPDLFEDSSEIAHVDHDQVLFRLERPEDSDPGI